MEPLSLPDTASQAAADVLYARVGVRVRAWLIDYFILAAAFLIAALVGVNVKVAGAGAVAFCAWAALFALYDPLMVWRCGGTIGHRLQNLRVVSDRTAGNPILAAVLLRHLIKTFLGIISLLVMMVSERQKALHDWLAGTTVQIRDRRVALRKDYVTARALVLARHGAGHRTRT